MGLLLNLADSLQKSGQLEQAVNTLDQLVRTEPSAKSYERLGAANFKLRRYEDAEAAFRKSIEIDPNHYPALNGVGVCLINEWHFSGQSNDAARDEFMLLGKILRIDPLPGLDAMTGAVTVGTLARLRPEKNLPRLVRAATRSRLVDVRHPTRAYPVATGRKRSGRRVLTVGTDCALGKKYTALALTRELQQRGVAATFINSTLTPAEREDRQQNLARYRLVYVAPERFRSPRFCEAVSRTPLSLVAVDEAHCISEWGHDFRPDYLRLGAVLDALGHPTVIALTATAAPDVRAEIVARLGLRRPRVLVAGFESDSYYTYSAFSHTFFKNEASAAGPAVEGAGGGQRHFAQHAIHDSGA